MEKAVEYKDFELQIGPQVDEEGFRLHVVRSPAGEGEGRLVLPPELGDLAAASYRPPVEIGGALFRALFSGEIADLFNQSLPEAGGRNGGRGLRLRLRIHPRTPALHQVPWELLHRPLTRLQAILLGGAAGAFVTPAELDVPLTFEGTRAIGATLGSAVVMPFDDTVDLKQILRRIAQFFRDESCGQCVPCRVGTVRQEELLHRLATEKPLGSVGGELAMLQELGQVMRDASICGLGQTVSSAVESALARFPSLYSQETQ